MPKAPDPSRSRARHRARPALTAGTPRHHFQTKTELRFLRSDPASHIRAEAPAPEDTR